MPQHIAKYYLTSFKKVSRNLYFLFAGLFGSKLEAGKLHIAYFAIFTVFATPSVLLVIGEIKVCLSPSQIKLKHAPF
jgi:hypothetical protein